MVDHLLYVIPLGNSSVSIQAKVETIIRKTSLGNWLNQSQSWTVRKGWKFRKGAWQELTGYTLNTPCFFMILWFYGGPKQIAKCINNILSLFGVAFNFVILQTNYAETINKSKWEIYLLEYLWKEPKSEQEECRTIRVELDKLRQAYQKKIRTCAEIFCQLNSLQKAWESLEQN